MASKLLIEELKAFSKEKKIYYRSYICKVPPSLRSLNEDAYEPRVVGLGPYHHDQIRLHPQRKFKLEALLRNLQRMSGDRHGSLEQKLGVVHTAVENRREEIMACYHDDLEFDANKLILDACFVIEVAMVKAGRAKDILERLTQRSAFTHSVLCDILKLENQVPLFLLKLIMGFQSEVGCDDLVRILTWACRRVFLVSKENEGLIRQEGVKMLESSSDSPAHLLECLQRLIIWNIRQDKNYPNQDNSLRNPDNASTNQEGSLSVKIDDESSQTKSNSIISQNKGIENNIVTNTSIATTTQGEFITVKIDGENSRTCSQNKGSQGNSSNNVTTAQDDSVTGKIDDGNPQTKTRSIMRSVARAENLAKVGIIFKAGTGLKFEEKLFKMKGVLYLPALHTRNDTETLLRNVIAFEECYCIPDNKVSRFIFLMGCLIDKEEDVALLRNEGLIDNSMDSEKAVADMFNGLTKHITTHYFTSSSDGIWEKLQEYHASSWRVMGKEFMDNHFSKPWLFCATIAAVLILILTIVQTYYTVKPTEG